MQKINTEENSTNPGGKYTHNFSACRSREAYSCVDIFASENFCRAYSARRVWRTHPCVWGAEGCGGGSEKEAASTVRETQLLALNCVGILPYSIHSFGGASSGSITSYLRAPLCIFAALISIFKFSHQKK